MAQTQVESQSEIQELREQIAKLETELRDERSKKSKKSDEKKRSSLADNLEKDRDEVNSLLQGMFFAGLESLAVAADVTRTMVDKAGERNDKRSSLSKKVTYMPVDVVEGILDAADESRSKLEQVVDKFYSKYKEAKSS